MKGGCECEGWEKGCVVRCGVLSGLRRVIRGELGD
jgi:hypothetical protein